MSDQPASFPGLLSQQVDRLVQAIGGPVSRAMAQQAGLLLAVALGLLLFSPRLTAAFCALSVLLALALVALTVIDIDRFRLPDVLTWPLIAAGVLLAPPTSLLDAIERAVAAMVGFGLLYGVAAFYLWRKGRAGLGLGDAKLFAASGAWVTVWGLPSVLLLATVLALASVGSAHLRGQAISTSTRLAFGPYLAGATWFVWLFGPVL